MAVLYKPNIASRPSTRFTTVYIDLHVFACYFLLSSSHMTKAGLGPSRVFPERNKEYHFVIEVLEN